MLKKHPKGIPPLGDLLADLGNPKPAEIAKSLGVSERTVRGWKRTGQAPRPVMLALFWVTSWGQQWAEAEAFNRAQIEYQSAAALRRHVKELEQIISRLMTIADFGCANDPSTSHHGPAANPAARMSHARTSLSCLTPVVRPGHLATVTR